MKATAAGEIGLAWLRVVLGAIMAYYGLQKAAGLFGGSGLPTSVEDMRVQYGIPALGAYLAIVAQLAGGLGLVAGLLTRVAAFGVACTMAVAVAVHAQSAATWDALAAGRNADTALMIEALALFAMSVCVMLAGPGRWALDSHLFGKGSGRKRGPKTE